MIIADKKFLAEIDTKAEALKEKIMNAKDELTYTGTAYYFSNSGDDANDGLSPEKAVCSLERFYSLPLKEGDAVFFERGGLWRGELLVKVKNITIGAYGEGPKPRFYGSLKNYAVPHEWVKTDRPNIWKYTKPFDIDIGHIICNGGKVHCIKKCLGHYGFGGTLDEVKNDLEFWCDRDDRNTLYFCSEQNPGERFFQIEMHRRISFFSLRSGQGARLDNLCIMYVGVHGISCGTFNDLHVTNCEIGYIGGGIQYTKGTRDTRLGNGVEIYGLCNDYSVENCYIHDCYDAGVTHQSKSAYDYPLIMENVRYTDNLFERCIYSIEYFCDQPNSDEDMMRHIRMTGNICRYAGGFGWQRPNRVARHIQGGWLNCKRKYPAEDYIVEGNIFDRSIDTLVSISSVKDEHLPVMKGNTYIQYAGKNYGANFVPYDHYKPFDEETERFIKETKGEADAVVAVVPEYDGLCD